MSFNNNRGNYNGGNSYGNNDRYHQNQNKPQKKKSGASFGYAQGDAARPYVRGWKANKSEGLISYIASPYESKTSKTKQHTSGSGRVWENWACKVTPKGQRPFFVSCLFEPATRKVIIPELAIVMNPKGGPGGYTGRNYYKKN